MPSPDEAALPASGAPVCVPVPAPVPAYRSPFDRWDAQSWVRSKPRCNDAFAPDLHFFPPDLCPPLVHPAVRALAPEARSRLLVHQLYLYLEFTVRLETGPVNEACLHLRSGTVLPWLPQTMRDDVLRIYTDEAGHAEMSDTLLSRVRAATGVEPLAHDPAFLAELATLHAEDSGLDSAMVTLFFVIVSETLITASLRRIPHDDRVQRQVRDLVADHAADEGRHHAYFQQLFAHLWPRLPPATRRRAGVLLPRMMLAFLTPDAGAMTAVLADCGVDQPAAVVSDVLTDPRTADGIREGARPSLRMFRAQGVFDDPEVSAAFAAAGLRRWGA